MMENTETKSFFPWKKKAILRGEELRKLRKRFKEMEESRDNWKEKSMNHKEIQATHIKLDKKQYLGFMVTIDHEI